MRVVTGLVGSKLLLLLELHKLPRLPSTQAAAPHMQQATPSFCTSSALTVWWHFVKIITVQTADSQKQHVYWNNMMAQTQTNRSASPAFPFCRASRNMPAIAQAPQNAETGCQSFTDTTEQISDHPLLQSLVEPRRKQ